MQAISGLHRPQWEHTCNNDLLKLFDISCFLQGLFPQFFHDVGVVGLQGHWFYISNNNNNKAKSMLTFWVILVIIKLLINNRVDLLWVCFITAENNVTVWQFPLLINSVIIDLWAFIVKHMTKQLLYWMSIEILFGTSQQRNNIEACLA